MGSKVKTGDVMAVLFRYSYLRLFYGFYVFYLFFRSLFGILYSKWFYLTDFSSSLVYLYHLIDA